MLIKNKKGGAAKKLIFAASVILAVVLIAAAVIAQIKFSSALKEAYVAKYSIPKGTELTEEMFELKKVKDAPSPFAFNNPACPAPRLKIPFIKGDVLEDGDADCLPGKKFLSPQMPRNARLYTLRLPVSKLQPSPQNLRAASRATVLMQGESAGMANAAIAGYTEMPEGDVILFLALKDNMEAQRLFLLEKSDAADLGLMLLE